MFGRRAVREKVQTTVVIRRSTWAALRELAAERAGELGGRPSASAVVERLVAAEVARRAEVERADR
jgi:hypothetical protein